MAFPSQSHIESPSNHRQLRKIWVGQWDRLHIGFPTISTKWVSVPMSSGGFSNIRWLVSTRRGPRILVPRPLRHPRLSLTESVNCGFPAPQLRIRVSVRSWESYLYHALRQFHLAKDFDPDSQDVASHLGYPLYQIRPWPEPLFAHVEDHSSADTESPDSGDGYLQSMEDDSQKTNITAAETHPSPPRFSNSIILTVLGIVGVHVLCRSLLPA
ncbi:hypothetical protein K438DRAFT_734250 [Mycena galopus ATCC 62051]|nr:hypothetical protein K438DRAFT_734250 [Mycena galopus ATCC 62051]